MNHPIPDLPCYLNGEFTTLPNAKVSVLDRGFVFEDTNLGVHAHDASTGRGDG